MRVPKATWSPPNPAAKSQFPQAGGPSSAAAPTSMKHRPITGTTRTENAPPVTKPVPYNSSQVPGRSEEHTSELQSRLHLVCRLLLEKKKNKQPARQDDARRCTTGLRD